MPVIKSAKKRMKQNNKARAKRFPVRNTMKTLFKNELELIKEGKLDEAVKFMPKVYSIIDTACKKNIIHPNNAARKKSRLARALNELQTNGSKAPKTEKAAAPEAVAPEAVAPEVPEVKAE